jgi:transposase InsO family protein
MGLREELMREVKDQHDFKFKKMVVIEAQKNGIRATCHYRGLARNTVRTWLRRFEAEGNKGLEDKRHGPNHIPHKTSKEIEGQVIEARNQVPCYGPRRLQYFFELPCSQGAIQRILKQNNLTRKRKKKYQKKNDMREMKRQIKAFGSFQMDIKHLYDMPNYWGKKTKLVLLPKYQYTIRDVKSGAAFLGFSDELSELNARTMLDLFLKKLREQLPKGQGVIIQTDNGVEFGGTVRHFERSAFTQLVHSYAAQHVFIPPKMCNANGDVESFHDTIEREFFDLATDIESRDDFMQQAESYRQFYNLTRPNYSKGAKTPWLIAQEDWPDSDIASKILLTSVMDLDKLNIPSALSVPSKVGQPMPVSPDFR